jgi:hypothetical protein
LPSLPLLENEVLTSVSISVYGGKNIIARYYKECRYELNDTFFYLVTQRFLGSAAYRKSLQHIGTWHGKYKVSDKFSAKKGGKDDCLKIDIYSSEVHMKKVYNKIISKIENLLI